MSMYGISDLQLAQLTAPKAAPYYYNNTPVQVNKTDGWVNGAQPGGVSSIGSTPVATGVAVDSPGNAAMGVQAGATAATGMPAGASTAAAGGGMGGYAGVATQAIQGIADAAQTYVKSHAQAEALRNSRAVPNIPESQGALAGLNAPPLKGLGAGVLNIG